MKLKSKGTNEWFAKDRIYIIEAYPNGDWVRDDDMSLWKVNKEFLEDFIIMEEGQEKSYQFINFSQAFDIKEGEEFFVVNNLNKDMLYDRCVFYENRMFNASNRVYEPELQLGLLLGDYAIKKIETKSITPKEAAKYIESFILTNKIFMKCSQEEQQKVFDTLKILKGEE